MANGRDANGRFVKGNQIGKGNNGGRPPRSREKRYYEITINTCAFDDWKAIVGRAVEDAKKGDSVARKWLADYIMGPPVQKHAVANVDWQSLTIDWGDNGDDSADADAA